MKKLETILPYILLVLFIGSLSLLGLVFSNTPHSIQVPSAKTLNDWTFEGQEIKTLPTNVDVLVGERFAVETVLPSDFKDKQTLLFRSSLQSIFVYLDEELIYSMDYEDYENYASMWHYVEIDAGSEGHSLRVELSSPYQAMRGVVNPVEYGDAGSLTKSLMFSYGYRLLIGLFTVIVGLILMVTSLFVYRKQNTPYIYLGLFAIVLGAWIVSESRLLQLFTGNVFVLGSISYIALSLIAVPLFVYLIFYVDKKYHKYFYIVIGVFSFLTPINIFLEILDIYDFFQSVVWTQVLLVVSVILAIILLILERFVHKNSEVNEVFNYVIVFSVFGFFELINFFRSTFDYTSYFMVIGVGIVMVMISYNYTRFIIERYKKSYEHEFYEYLAYHDPITGAMNRLAFEQDFDQVFSDEEKLSSLRLLYFDLDNLKYINDQYGHLEGDVVIKKGYDIIQNTFGFYGNVYRIGGDEFACLASTLNEALYKETKKEFEGLVNSFDIEKDYHFGLSIGASSYKTGDVLPEDLIIRADQEMYEYKDLTKKKQARQEKVKE